MLITAPGVFMDAMSLMTVEICSAVYMDLKKPICPKAAKQRFL